MREDPLWTSLEGAKFMRRDQLELVMQKKKLVEAFKWFKDHFVECTQAQYTARCPIVILQGPTGCGKTSTLKWISNELKVPIREYSETTDLTALNHELARSTGANEYGTNLSHSIDRRKAVKFEHFVINNIMYNPLYTPASLPRAESDFESDDDDLGKSLLKQAAQNSLPQEDSEFESDDECFKKACNLIQPAIKNGTCSTTKGPPPITGVIIHIDTPLLFARSQRILIQTLHRLIKIIKEISPRLRRRAAIVFETLEGEGEIISLPTKIKMSLKIEVIKFNPIIKANMKKLVTSLIENFKHITIEKETVEQLVSDCDGDIRACINTLQLICNKSSGPVVFKPINNNSMNFNGRPLLQVQQANKKQKLLHEKVTTVKLNAGLMRDNTRSLGFFHVLGKIFYQKRIYPKDGKAQRERIYLKDSKAQLERIRSIDRPFRLENNTEYLASLIDVQPKNLVIWLHQHYYNFCGDDNIEKAALFMENLSAADTTSLNSTQSTQFYEIHSTIDQLQTHLTIESTTFSLYEDWRLMNKEKNKKTITNSSGEFIAPSVETSSRELLSFRKPALMNLTKLVEDYQTLLQCCRVKIIQINSKNIDPLKVLLDYVPYISHMSANWDSLVNKTEQYTDSYSTLYDADTLKVFKTLNELADKPNSDLETRHEQLLEMIENMDMRQNNETQVI